MLWNLYAFQFKSDTIYQKLEVNAALRVQKTLFKFISNLIIHHSTSTNNLFSKKLIFEFLRQEKTSTVFCHTRLVAFSSPLVVFFSPPLDEGVWSHCEKPTLHCSFRRIVVSIRLITARYHSRRYSARSWSSLVTTLCATWSKTS